MMSKQKLELKPFIKQAFRMKTYKNLIPHPDGIHFWLHCPHKTNKNFTPEIEDIFKDWDELRGRQYDWYKSKERFLNALKGSCYFTVLPEKEDASYFCKFNSRDEIAEKRAKKKGKCQANELPQRSPSTSPRSGSPSDILQPEQDVSSCANWLANNLCFMVPGSRFVKEHQDISITGPAQAMDMPLPTQLENPLHETNGLNLPNTCAPDFNNTAARKVTNVGNESISIHAPQLVSVNAVTYCKDMNKPVPVQNAAFVLNGVPMILVKSDLNASVFTSTSGNECNAVPESNTIPTYHLTLADVATDCNNSSDAQSTVLSPNYTNVVPVVAAKKENCNHQLNLLLSTSSSSTSDILPKSTAALEPQSQCGNLSSYSTNNSEGGMCSDLSAMKEELNVSMDTENQLDDNSSWMSTTLTLESSPLDASIGYDSSNISQDFTNTHLFSESLITMSDPSSDAGGEPQISLVSQSPCIQGESVELPRVEVPVDSDAITSSNEAFNGNISEDEKYEADHTSNNLQFLEELGGDSMDTDQNELSDAMINEVINSIYNEVFPVSPLNQVPSEALGASGVKNRTGEAVCAGNTGNGASGESAQPYQFLVSANNGVIIKNILEAISCIPGISYSAVPSPVQNALSSNSGDLRHGVMLGNCHPPDNTSCSDVEVAAHCWRF